MTQANKGPARSVRGLSRNSLAPTHLPCRATRAVRSTQPRATFERLEDRRLLSVNLALDADTVHQTIDGFGASMAGWVRRAYTDQPTYADVFYRDLGSSMLRIDLNPNALVPPGGTLATPVWMSADIETNISKFNFNADFVEAYGWLARDANTKKLDDVKIIASIWSPPHFMKGNEVQGFTGEPTNKPPRLTIGGSNTAGGSLIDTPENLEQFGRYVAAFVKGFERHWGVKIEALSVQNELFFSEEYNSAVYSPQLYVKALKAVDQAFTRYNITTKLQGPEDVGVGAPDELGILSRQMRYIRFINEDPQAKAALDIYSIHGYSDERSPDNWGYYWNGRNDGGYYSWPGIKQDNKRSWQTERSGEPHTWDGAMSLALNAQDALVQSNVSAWLYWLMSSDKPAGVETLTTGVDTTTKKYNAAKHFFRYIRPGAQRIEIAGNQTWGVYGSAYVHSEDETLTLVLINSKDTADTARIDTRELDVSSFNIVRRTSATDTWRDLGTQSISGGFLNLSMPARSIVTLQAPLGRTAPTPPPTPAPPPPIQTPGPLPPSTRPTVLSSSFDPLRGGGVNIRFNQDVSASLNTWDLYVENLANRRSVPVSSFSYDRSTNTARFAFAPGALPDAEFRVTLNAAGVANTQGLTVASNLMFNFFFLQGDINRDRLVDLSDLTILANFFGEESTDFLSGDLNADARTDFDDLLILANQYGKRL